VTLRRLFTINVPISLLFGIGCVFFPDPLMARYGVELSSAGVAMTQLAGAAFFGWAVLAFQARSGSGDLMRAAAVALLVQDAIAAIVSIIGQVGGPFGWLGWTTPLVYGLLGAGYAYFLFVDAVEHPGPKEPGSAMRT
jgi:hypothetical protein